MSLKICLISDTHTHHGNLDIPDCDILVHSGDWSYNGTLEEYLDFESWLVSQKQAKHKIFISGNHDWTFQHNPILIKQIHKDLIYLHDSEVTVEGLRIYGTPWTNYFFDWAFQGIDYQIGDYRNNYRGGPPIQHTSKYPGRYPLLKDVYEKIPSGLDILVTHTPPYGILDRNPIGDRCGSYSLMERINVVAPKIHAFGHIHHSRGVMTNGTTLFYNVASLNEGYRPYDNPITLIDL